jgi:hypothetical protein
MMVMVMMMMTMTIMTGWYSPAWGRQWAPRWVRRWARTWALPWATASRRSRPSGLKSTLRDRNAWDKTRRYNHTSGGMMLQAPVQEKWIAAKNTHQVIWCGIQKLCIPGARGDNAPRSARGWGRRWAPRRAPPWGSAIKIDVDFTQKRVWHVLSFWAALKRRRTYRRRSGGGRPGGLLRGGGRGVLHGVGSRQQVDIIIMIINMWAYPGGRGRGGLRGRGRGRRGRLLRSHIGVTIDDAHQGLCEAYEKHRTFGDE